MEGSEMLSLLRAMAMGLAHTCQEGGAGIATQRVCFVSSLIFCSRDFEKQNEEFTNNDTLLGSGLETGKSKSKVLAPDEGVSAALVHGGRQKCTAVCAEYRKGPTL